MTPANAGEYCALENNNGRRHNLAEYIISQFKRNIKKYLFCSGQTFSYLIKSFSSFISVYFVQYIKWGGFVFFFIFTPILSIVYAEKYDLYIKKSLTVSELFSSFSLMGGSI